MRRSVFLFDFIEGGVDDETGLFRNEDAFASYQLLPRYLNDISLRTETDLVMADIGCTQIPALGAQYVMNADSGPPANTLAGKEDLA